MLRSGAPVVSADPSGWIPIGVSTVALLVAAGSLVVAGLSYRLNRATARQAGWLLDLSEPEAYIFDRAHVVGRIRNRGRADVQIDRVVLHIEHGFDHRISPEITVPVTVDGGGSQELRFSYDADQQRLADRIDATLRVHVADGTKIERQVNVPVPVHGPTEI
jgi:hypothetical protein